MAAIAFDTLKFANRLKTAGVPPAQAEAEAEVLADVFESNLDELATKADLRELEMRLDAKMDKRFAEVDKRFVRVEGEFLLLKWMLGVVIAGMVSLVIKAFLW
ncbi:hypothetical protein DFQ28_001085 [Apophysomyces sp. BC1034]|nr:hypothetical protein DFQ28_001085 [Apophysomyces sp. BC1034]